MDEYKEVENLSGVSVSDGISWIDPEDFVGLKTYQIVDIAITETDWGKRAKLKLYCTDDSQHYYVSSWNMAMNEATKYNIKKGSTITLKQYTVKKVLCEWLK